VTELYTTRRAIRDLAGIRDYSNRKWGQKVADAYLAKFEQAFDRLKASPALLTAKREVSGCLLFYRVERHWLVCDILEDCIYVLAVKHGAMDLPERIQELEPQLVQEAQLLHNQAAGE